MGAEDLRYDDMEEEDAWRGSDYTAFRFVEHVLQSVRMVRCSSPPSFARPLAFVAGAAALDGWFLGSVGEGRGGVGEMLVSSLACCP
jgi:hypothetical protein